MSEKNKQNLFDREELKGCWQFSVIGTAFVFVLVFFKQYSKWGEMNPPLWLYVLFLLVGIVLLPFIKKIKALGVEVETRDEKHQVPYNVPEIINARPEIHEYINLATSLCNQKRYMESIKFFLKADDADRNNWLVKMYLGFLYLSLEDVVVSNDWCFTDTERLMRSIFYSKQATELDPNHFNQYMNLGVAQCKLGGEKLLKEGIKNIEVAFNMLCYDPIIQGNPALMTEKAKCRSFMGLFTATLGNYENASENRETAIRYYEESINLFDAVPDTRPGDRAHFRGEAKKALKTLKSETG